MIMDQQQNKEELDKLSLALVNEQLRQPFLTAIQPDTSKKAVFETPQEVEAAILAYFNFCEDKLYYPTVNGLSLALNTDWDTLKKIMNDENSILGGVVRRSITHIAALVEEGVLSGKTAKGGIFWLKNIMDWKDKSEVQTTKVLTAAEVIKELNKESTLIEGEIDDDTDNYNTSDIL